ncbi:uncharacterized protein LOC119661986 [Teleopsis dalmanni]|uniref:uncharacterized protein LOC119661986 n=1 Tax=Teleopsis dalmanni TaxID=139649 RepID=UPI0018CD06BE|nr:uncharacterized protein LOC119661986 [Teleopsis dalmanni]
MLHKYRKRFYGSITFPAEDFVNEVITGALNKLARDRHRYFMYKRPFIIPEKSSSSLEESCEKDQSEMQNIDLYGERVQWVSIEDFSYLKAVRNIRDFIDLWHLPRQIKYSLLNENRFEDIAELGSNFFVKAMFSVPTKKNPNPVTVAYVRFRIHVSAQMPMDYPIMVSYLFDGFKTVFYALGEYRMLGSFPKYFILNILRLKFQWYDNAFKWRTAEERRLALIEPETPDDENAVSTVPTFSCRKMCEIQEDLSDTSLKCRSSPQSSKPKPKPIIGIKIIRLGV